MILFFLKIYLFDIENSSSVTCNVWMSWYDDNSDVNDFVADNNDSFKDMFWGI